MNGEPNPVGTKAVESCMVADHFNVEPGTGSLN
jgi:hypothetical protein